MPLARAVANLQVRGVIRDSALSQITEDSRTSMRGICSG